MGGVSCAKKDEFYLGAWRGCCGIRLSLLKPKLLPFLIHDPLHFGAGAVLFGPAAVEAFVLPFARAVYAHLRSEADLPRGVVEHVYGPQHELNVAFGIDVVQHFPDDLSRVLHVHVFIDDDDAFGEHRLAQSPDRVHDLARVAGVLFAYRDQHQVVEDALERQIHVHDFGELALKHGQRDADDRPAHPTIFHRRAAYDRRLIDRIFAVGDGRDMEDRVRLFESVEAGVVAERPFDHSLRRVYVAFEHDLGGRRNLHVDRDAFDHLDRLFAKEACEDHLVEVVGQRQGRGEIRDRLGADGHGDLHPFGAALLLVTVMRRAVFMNLPMHPGGLFVVNLHSVHPAVALARARVSREDHREGDEAASVGFPAFQNRKVEQRKLAFAFYNFLARPRLHLARKVFAQL